MITVSSLTKPSDNLQIWVSWLVLLTMLIAITTALGFEHIGGYMPCKLCLEERIPYYIGIPLMIWTIFLSFRKSSGVLIRLLFFVLALLMAYNFGLSVYHAGAEYKFWPGPTDCSAAATAITIDAKNVLANLNSKLPPSCDTAAGYFFGLSFAGWNGVCSLFLTFCGFLGAFFRLKSNDLA